MPIKLIDHKCNTSRPSLHQVENTSRRVTFEELSSAGADVTEEHEGIKLQNLTVGIK